MKYAILFDTKADADKLASFLKTARIRYASIEVLDGTVMDQCFKVADVWRDMALALNEKLNEKHKENS